MTEINHNRERKDMNNQVKGVRNTRRLFIAIVSALSLMLAVITPMQAAKANDEITFVTPAWQPDVVKAMKDAVATWNKANPKTPVKLIPGDWGNLSDQLTTQFASRTAPDVIHFESIAIREFAKRGYIADITREMRSLQRSIPAGEWSAASYQGKLVGVPFLDQTYVVFANVDLFKKAGVAIPTNQSGVTWDEFAALSKRMTNSNHYGLSYGLLRPATSFMVMSTNFGAKYFRGYTAGKASIRIGNPELEVATRVYDMVYNDKSIDPGSLTVSAGGSVAPFLAGKTAMLFMGSYAAIDLDVAAKEKGFNWTALPLLKGTSQMQAANPQTFSISQQSTKKRDAARFIRFLMNDDNVAKFAIGDGLVPLTTSAMKAAQEAKKSSPGWTQIFADGQNFTVAPFAYVPEFLQWRSTVVQPALQNYIQNKISRAELAKRLEDGWKTLR